MRLNIFLKLISIVLITCFGYGCSDAKNQEDKTSTQPSSQNAPLVEAGAVVKEGRQYTLEGEGFLSPARQARVVSEVQGTVVYKSDELETGRRFAQGDVLYRVDPTTYKANALKAEAALEAAKTKQAKTQADLERFKTLLSQDTIAKTRFEEVKLSLASAKAAVKQAQAEKTLATQALEDTTVRAPFNCIISEQNVTVGSFVSPGMSIVRVIGADDLEMMVGIDIGESVSVERALREGNRQVDIILEQTQQVFNGVIDSKAPVVDSKTRTINYLVSLPGVLSDYSGPSLVGQYAKVFLPAQANSSLYKINSRALRDNAFVFVIDQNHTLKQIKVDVIKRKGDFIWVTSPVEFSENKILITRLINETDGLQVRLSEADE